MRDCEAEAEAVVFTNDVRGRLILSLVLHLIFNHMSQEDYPVEFVLDSLERIMAPKKQPKVLLFDIGGVCVC